MANATGGKPGGARTVRVATSARLHLGFLDLNGNLGRRFGSIGLSLDAPVTRLSLEPSSEMRVLGPEAERAERYLSRMVDELRVPRGHRLTVEAAIPAHSGLGSGTQLALAVASAVRLLHGFAPDPRGDATRLGRGARSGVGIGLFERGGLVVDGGRGRRVEAPPLLTRLSVPSAWRVLLVMDPDRAGLAGGAERAAFASLPLLSETTTGRICRLVLMLALPALAESDLATFGFAVTELQRILGEHFAPAQGGRFTSPRVAAALARLAAAGAAGIGQSSWGPTGFAFAADQVDAERLAATVADQQAFSGLDWTICRALNRGASVTAG